MIYLDNAAGSYPKPPSVAEAMYRAFSRYGANPGRGSHALCRQTAALVERLREQLCRLLHIADPSRLAFTAGATAGLNQAICGLLFRGGHAVCSSMEHNAVRRPLEQLQAWKRASYSVAAADPVTGRVSAAAYRCLLRPDTRLLIVNHGSNVNGAVQPLSDLAALSRDTGIPLLADASQSAGLLPIDVSGLDIAMIALPAHKALYGPAGAGALYVRPGLSIEPWLSGGTGGDSELPLMPEYYPQRLEAGSLPIPAMAGWSAALDALDRAGDGYALRHTLALTARLREGLAEIKGLRLLDPGPGLTLPVLSCVMEGLSPQQAAAELDERGVCVRAGYHCAPLAHQTLGTFDSDGTIRFSPGLYTRPQDIDATLWAVRRIAGKGIKAQP